MPDPINSEIKNLFIGAHKIIGKNAPRAIAIPPIRGIGSQWIFLEFGISRRLILHARFIKIGMSRMVIMVDNRNVENKVIWKFIYIK
jgi:hypothetical protein